MTLVRQWLILHVRRTRFFLVATHCIVTQLDAPACYDVITKTGFTRIYVFKFTSLLLIIETVKISTFSDLGLFKINNL